MTVAREAVIAALLARLSTGATFRSIGRRNRAPSSIPPAQTPALMLVEHSEVYRNASTAQPSVRRLKVMAIVYCDSGSDQNAIPAAQVNAILDAFDAALAPDDPVRGRCTLGGLVTSVVVDGTIVKAPGEVTGKSLAVVPLDILLP